MTKNENTREKFAFIQPLSLYHYWRSLGALHIIFLNQLFDDGRVAAKAKRNGVFLYLIFNLGLRLKSIPSQGENHVGKCCIVISIEILRFFSNR